MSITDKLCDLKDKTKAHVLKGKEALYKEVADISQKIENREGGIGKTADLVEGVITQGKKVYHSPQVQLRVKVIKDGLSALGEKGYDLYERLRDDISHEGVVDIQKVEELIKKGASATEKFGEKAVQSLNEMIEKGWAAVKTDYRSIIPSKEELKSKYAGIGTDYKGVLLRKNIEECLAFYQHAKKRKTMANHVKYREEILNYIKASASSNTTELSDYLERKYYEVRKQQGEKSPEAKKQYAIWNQAAKFLWLPTIKKPTVNQ